MDTAERDRTSKRAGRLLNPPSSLSWKNQSPRLVTQQLPFTDGLWAWCMMASIHIRTTGRVDVYTQEHSTSRRPSIYASSSTASSQISRIIFIEYTKRKKKRVKMVPVVGVLVTKWVPPTRPEDFLHISTKIKLFLLVFSGFMCWCNLLGAATLH